MSSSKLLLALVLAALLPACTKAEAKSPCEALDGHVKASLDAVVKAQRTHKQQTGSYASLAALEERLGDERPEGLKEVLAIDVLRADAEGFLVSLTERAPPAGSPAARWYVDQREALRSRDNRCKKTRKRALIDMEGVVRAAFERPVPVKAEVLVHESQRSLSGKGTAAFVLTLDGQTLATWMSSRAAERFRQGRPGDDVKRLLDVVKPALQDAEVWADLLDGADLTALLDDERLLWRVEGEGDEARLYLVDLTGCTFVYVDVKR